MDDRTLEELLEEKARHKEELVRLGVPVDVIPQVLERIQSYQDVENTLVQARETQFWNTATDITGLSGTNKAERAAKILRQFAERITEQAFKICDTATTPERITEIVDVMADREELG